LESARLHQERSDGDGLVAEYSGEAEEERPDSASSPLRAPFTRYKGVSGPAELAEEARGGGVRKAVGELVTCPFCLSQWVATGFVLGFALAPRPTRMAASVFASLALADFLQFGYVWAERKAE
jgi:hypothetical protein